jgi:regulator of cell morphogenesis and NO signaling
MKGLQVFGENSKMADVIHKDYSLIPILGRFGIKLGFGNQSVKEICDSKGIDVGFLLEIINLYHDPDYFPENHLRDYKAKQIVDYLSHTHQYYLNVKIPQIERYIQEMEKDPSIEVRKNIGLLRKFFQEYKDEIQEHFKEEEENVFPYILSLENALKEEVCGSDLIQRIKNCPIEIYERHHDNLDIKLSDMKNIIIRFLPPVQCEDTCEQLLVNLFRMESDLEDHTRIEENVLIPNVKKLERKVMEIYGVTR